MKGRDHIILGIACYILVACCGFNGFAQNKTTTAKFHVLAFYTAKHDLAHISFVHEANE